MCRDPCSTLLTLFALLSTAVLTVGADDTEILTRNDALLEKLHEEWCYPETGVRGRGRTGSIATIIQQSEDSYADVWQHYADKCGFDLKYEGGLYVMGRETDGTVYLVDDRRDKETGQRTQTFFVVNAPDHSVTVILEPQPGDRPVRVTLTITAR